MHAVARGRTAPPRQQVAVIAILIGAIWAVGGLMPLGAAQSDPPTLLDQVAVPTFSLMLATFALVAWLIVGLARPSRWVLTGAATMAIGGIVAGVGNFAEDGLRIAGAEYVYGLGFFTLLIGLVGTTIVLLVRRELIPVLLVALSLAGFMIAADHGPNIVPVVWFGLAAWVLVRRPQITALHGPRGIGHEIEGSS